MKQYQAVVIGAGPAGLGAAVTLKEQGINDILVLEREAHAGGILRQCIHDGFGLTQFGESLSGPEYAQRFLDKAQALGIEIRTGCTVLELNQEKQITICSCNGLEIIQAKAVILSMGCRERTRGALAIPGTRPAGVMTAGVAQNYINLQNVMVGKEVVILGSGDIGLIMARRMTLEGATVKGVYEVQPYPSGLPRNLEQCLNDYNIPLHLSHTVTNIYGKQRLEGIEVSQVDETMRPIAGTQQKISCDTLILSVGLIPENELSIDAGVTLDARTKGAVVDEHFQTDVAGVFAAGNVLHVHDLVDFVTQESQALAVAVAEYIKTNTLPECALRVNTAAAVGHIIPQKISGTRDVTFSLRVRTPMKDCAVIIRQNGKELVRKKMKKALPAEMIRIAVKAAALQKTGELEVSVE